MKFNIRSIDKDNVHQTSVYRTHTHSSSSSSSYTAGFPTNGKFGGGAEMCRGRLETRENIQREIEKDKIRQEIIAAEMEMERRLVLEVEVRNEMMMERQMGLGSTDVQFMPLSLPSRNNNNLFDPRVLHQKPSGFEERIAASIEEKYNHGSQIVPFQGFGDSSKVNAVISKKEVIVLTLVNHDLYNKTQCRFHVMYTQEMTMQMGKSNGETTLPGLKRKSTPAASEGSSESRGDVSKKKQATVEWSCAVCQVSATSERGLNEHVEGKKHKVREAALIASKTGANFGLGVAAKKPIVKPVKLALTTVDLSCSDTKKTKPIKKTLKMGKTSSTPDSNKYKFWCEICQVGAFSEKVMNNHKDGKKHLKTLSELPQKAKLESKDPATEKTDDTEVKTETNEAVVFEIVASEEITETETKEDIVVELVASEEKSETETNKKIVVEVIKTVKDHQQDVTDTLVEEERSEVKTVKDELENVSAEEGDTIRDDMMEAGVAEDVSM